MNKNWKRALCLLLALSAASVAGCSGSPSSGSSQPSPSSSPAQNQPSSGSTAPASTAQPSGEVPTIRVLMQARAEGPISNDMPFIKNISEKAGINFNWELAPSDANQYTEKFNILVASGDIPDLMIHHDMNVLNNGGINHVFEDLLPWVDSSMPNIQKLFSEREGMKKDIMTDDGHLYYLPRLTAVRTFGMFLVRDDIVKKEGLSMPTTTDEMYEFLKFFQTYDLNKNGQQDEIPWTCRGKFNDLNGFMEPFGVYIKDAFFEENGEVKYTYSDPRFLEGLRYVSKLYGEGLIDAEYSTNDMKVWESRLTNELSAITYDNFVRIDYLNNLIKQVNPEAEFVSIPPLKNQEGKAVTKEQQNKYGKGTSVSAKSQYKEQIIKFLDWIHSEEGHIATNFGIEGETFVREGDTFKYTDLVMKDPDNAGMSKLILLGFRDMWPYRSDIAYENAMNSDNQNTQRDNYEQYVVGDKWPTTLTFTEEERGIINTTYQEVKTYTDEMINQYVMGIESTESFDEYLNTLEKLGLPEVLKVQQAAYDRYRAR